MSMPVAVGPESQFVSCPSCGAQVQSKIVYQTSTRTHIIAALLCLFICWPCVCVPYCCDSPSCRNVTHRCPKCDAYIGTYKS